MIPTPYTVTREVYTPGAADAHNNVTDAWAAAIPVLVHGWAPASADKEPFESGRSPVVRDLDLYAPSGTVSAPRDRWTVDGTPYESVGHEDDYTHGPFGWAAGVRINLLRVEG